jgi:hypothetical protein
MKYLKIVIFSIIFLFVIGINFCSRTVFPTEAEIEGRVLCDIHLVGVDYRATCAQNGRCYNFTTVQIPLSCKPAFSPNIFNYEIIYGDVDIINWKPILCSDSVNISVMIHNQLLGRENINSDYAFDASYKMDRDTFMIILTDKSDTLSIYTLIFKPDWIQ